MGNIVLVPWLADVLRDVGITVVEHPGWKTRSRPTHVGSFHARGVMLHEDGSRPGASPYEPEYLIHGDGEGSTKPGPLCHLWIDTVGRWHTIAAGRCNHAGVGPGWGIVPGDSGNTYCIGIETDNTEGERWTPAMRATLVPGITAILRRLAAEPHRVLMGHKEYAPGRKSDPDSITMATLRSDVATALAGHPQEDDVALTDDDIHRIHSYSGGAYRDSRLSPSTDSADAVAVSAYQEAFHARQEAAAAVTILGQMSERLDAIEALLTGDTP